MALDKKKAAAILSNPHSSGTALLLTLVDELGTDFFSWEPTTLDEEVKDTWRVEMPQIVRDKVWAMVNYLTTNLFFTSLEVFIHTANALSSGTHVDMKQYDPATVAEIAWALMETELLEPPDSEDAFSDEIMIYMAKELEAEGFRKVPKMLRKYVTMPDEEERINENLAMDGVDYNSFWDAQQKKTLALDEALVNHLLRLLEELNSLSLSNARPGVLQELASNARKALEERQKSLRTAEQTVSQPPAL